MAQFRWPDCPADVHRQVGRLLDGFRSVLAAERLVGLYLHGSLATGCFNPLRSDIDLLAVMAGPMHTDDRYRIAGMLLEVSRQPSPVEVSLLTRDHLCPWRYPTPFDFHFSEDWRPALVDDLASGAWRAWPGDPRCDTDLAEHIGTAQQRGVCLWGLPTSEAFPAVPRADFVASILADVLDDRFGLTSDLSHPVYVILNACRTLAYLRTGQILSKDEGGVWALRALPGRFEPVIAAALDAYRHRADEGDLARELVAEFAGYLAVEIVDTL